ncbi:MAG: alcohol dehydrogenase catalytic domain-containing protein [Lachnospiraceae bacterium]|nr:alcohol dehydrogenase catalytic domain-containing protein [Lachnospiraceae bacterium]
MKAICKTKREAGVELCEIPMPKINRDEVLIKIKCAALCNSDVEVYQYTPLVAKANYDLPFVMGHEFAGEIVEVGEAVQGFAIGDKVAAETHIPCGYCETCRGGHQHICGNHMGVLGRTVDGCFAEYIKLHQKALIKLPENISYEEGSVFEPFATAVHAVAKAQPMGKTMLICGTGTIGQMAVLAAKLMGAVKIFANDISDEKLVRAKEFGADVLINGMKENLTEVVLRETNGYGVDTILDFTGNEKVINQCVEVAKIAGTIVHIGMVGKPLTYQNFMYGVVYKELNISGIYGREMHTTWQQVNNLLETGKIDLHKFVTKKMKLEEFDQAVEEFINYSGRIVFEND